NHAVALPSPLEDHAVRHSTSIIKTENCQQRNGAQRSMCTAEIQNSACLRWVKMRTTHIEQNRSALPPIATVPRTSRHFSYVPKGDACALRQAPGEVSAKVIENMKIGGCWFHSAREVALWLAIACILVAAIGFSWNPTPFAHALAAIFIACAIVHAG